MSVEDDTGTPPTEGRYIDIELSSSEVITIDLDRLEEDPQDYAELLNDSNCEVNIWMKLSTEYWKMGHLFEAQLIASKAAEYFKGRGQNGPLASICRFQANLYLAEARTAPKMILENARQDDIRDEKIKDYYYRKAALSLNEGDSRSRDLGVGSYAAFITRGVYQLARNELDDAQKSFDAVLSEKPHNIIATLGKARISYARKRYTEALKHFQVVLTLVPTTQPDPRIGIGLCFWALDLRDKARMAWERSLEVNPQSPTSWAARLLLGLDALNASKNAEEDEQTRAESFMRGFKYLECAFKANKKNASAANALFSLYVGKGDKNRALKLAERTIQFADILTLYAAGHINAGYIHQLENRHSNAAKHFQAALKSNPKNVLAAIGLAQTQIKNDEIPAAIHTLDSLVQPPIMQKPLEAIVLLAALRAFPRPGVSSSDAAVERQRARELYDHILKGLNVGASTATFSGKIDLELQRKASAQFGDDIDLLLEVARLWQDESREKMRRVLEAAVQVMRARQADGSLAKGQPRLLNNLAVLRQLDGEIAEARTGYEEALMEASSIEGRDGDSLASTLLYNLARAYEDQGEVVLAKDAYDKLLGRHPEYVDAKIRQAYLLLEAGRAEDAHELLKASHASSPKNLNVRAALTHFLITHGLLKPAKDLVIETLKSVDSHDVFSACAAGWVQFHQARENRDASSKGQEERKKGYSRAVEFYDRALQLDPKCAFAAQGLAIISAEDAIAPPRAPGASGADEAARRIQNAREALEIFGKVRESVNDASVYVNMGHCYFARDEFDRAIESYETALKRHRASPAASFGQGSGVEVMIVNNLCRAWYAKANKDQSYKALQQALRQAQAALHIQPGEKAGVYNIAMIMQKAAEMLFAIAPVKRTLKELEQALEQGTYAQNLFASLAADKSHSVPYDRDIAFQRRKYGESLLRRGDENLAKQRAHEAEQEERIAAARERRQQERDRMEAAERERSETLRAQAEMLAEQRRKAREEAQAWTLALMGDSDEEDGKRERGERRKKGKKQRSENVSAAVSGDEGAVAASQSEGRKKRKGKLRKETGPLDGEEEEEEALFSGAEEGDDKPKKRAQKKRVVRDDDEEEAAVTTAPRKKQFKSKETISDSDEEMS